MFTQNRVFGAVVGVSITFAAVLFAPPWLFMSLIAVVSVLALNEFLTINGLRQLQTLHLLSIVYFGVLCLSLVFRSIRELNVVPVLAVLGLLITPLILQASDSLQVKHLGLVMLGAVYVYMFTYFVGEIRLFPKGRELIVVLIAATWGRDIGAYIFGKLVKRKLLPAGHPIWRRVSPRKTFEGAIFALVCTCFVVYISAEFVQLEWGIQEMIVTGMTIGILGQIGDLVESWFKRQTGVTDSSSMIPAQGGILDAIDGFMFTAPILYCYVVLEVVTGMF